APVVSEAGVAGRTDGRADRRSGGRVLHAVAIRAFALLTEVPTPRPASTSPIRAGLSGSNTSQSMKLITKLAPNFELSGRNKSFRSTARWTEIGSSDVLLASTPAVSTHPPGEMSAPQKFNCYSTASIHAAKTSHL